MKKITKYLLALLLFIGMSACAKKEEVIDDISNDRLENILAKGKLVVATSPDYAPLEFIDPNKSGQDQYIGSDIALAYYIGEQLGVEVEIAAMDFTTVLSSVDLGKADIAISGFGWKEDREQEYELSIGFNQTGESSCQGLMVKKDKDSEYKSLKDFANKKIVAQSGSLQENYVNTQIDNAELQIVTDLTSALLMLKADKVDAFACSCDQMDAYEKANDDIVRSKVEFDTTVESMHDGNVLAVKKGEINLINRLNEILTDVNEQGLYEKWSVEAKAKALELGLEFEE